MCKTIRLIDNEEMNVRTWHNMNVDIYNHIQIIHTNEFKEKDTWRFFMTLSHIEVIGERVIAYMTNGFYFVLHNNTK